jgi:hypothetical protein
MVSMTAAFMNGAELKGDDIILCQITTRARAGYAIDHG